MGAPGPSRWASLRGSATVGTIGAGFGVQALLLVSGVLAARLLGAEDRGHLAVLWVVALTVVQLGTLGIPTAATYFLAREPGRASATVRSLALPAALQLAVLLCVDAVVLALVLDGEAASVRTSGAVTLGAIPALMMHGYGLAILQGRRRFAAFNGVRLLFAGLYAVGLLVLLLADEEDLVAVTAVWVGTVALSGAVTLRLALRGLDLGAGAGEPAASLREMIDFGLRALLGTFNLSDQLQLDQLLAAVFLSPFALGLYVVAVAFTNLPRFIGLGIGMVAYPTVAGMAETSRASRAVWRYGGLAAGICLVVVIALLLVMPDLLPALFGDEFREGVDAARILLVGSLFIAVRRALSDGARGAGRPTIGTVAEVASLASLAVFLPLFTDGTVEGVALALTASALTGLVLLAAGLLLVHGPERENPTAGEESGVGIQGPM